MRVEYKKPPKEIVELLLISFGFEEIREWNDCDKRGDSNDDEFL